VIPSLKPDEKIDYLKMFNEGGTDPMKYIQKVEPASGIDDLALNTSATKPIPTD